MNCYFKKNHYHDRKKIKLVVPVLLLALFTCCSFTASAKRFYWIGKTGNWGTAANWSLTPNGAGQTLLPTTADSVYFTQYSFNAPGQTVTINVAANCRNMDWTGALYNPTLSGAAALNISGSLKLIPAMTLTYNGALKFCSTLTGQTITTAGKTFAGAITFGSAAGGGWTLMDNLTVNNTINHAFGTLNTNGKNVSCTVLNENYATARILNLSSSVITLSGSGTACNINATGLTLNSGTSLLKFTGAAASAFAIANAPDGFLLNNIQWTGSASTATINNTHLTNKCVFNNVTFAGNATINGNNTFNGTLSLTAGKTATFQTGKTTAFGTNGQLVSNGSCNTPAIIKSSTTVPAIFSKPAPGITLQFVKLNYITAQSSINAPFVAANSTQLGCTGWTVTGGTPSVTISSGTIYSGTPVTFTPSPVNGGTAPVYTWYKNNVVAGTGPTYTSSTVVNGNSIKCRMVSNAGCVNPVTATSNSIVMTPPVLNFALSNDTVPPGDTLMLTNLSTGFSASSKFLWEFSNCAFADGFTSQTICSKVTTGSGQWVYGTMVTDGISEIRLSALDDSGTIIPSIPPVKKNLVTAMKANACLGSCHDPLPWDKCGYICNGDFEFYSTCPNAISQICRAEPWTISQVNGYASSTPDYFNACMNCTPFTYNCVSVPQSNSGYQNGYNSSNGYAGIVATAFNPPCINFEYIQQSLKAPLTQGERYHVEMYLSLAERSQYAAGDLQMYFTNGQPQQPPSWGQLLAAFPSQLTTPSPIIADKQNWVLYSADFIAPVAGLDWVSIGIFNPNAAYLPNQPVPGYINNVNYSPGWPDAYIYIDNVSVVFEPAITASPTQVCPGQSTVLSIQGMGSYLWSTGQTTQSITVSPAFPTTYSCTVTSANGCSKVLSILIGITPPPPQPQLTGPFHNCTPGASSHYSIVNPPAGYAYNWSFPAGEAISASNTNGPDFMDVIWKNPFSTPRIDLIVTGIEPMGGCLSTDTITIYQCCDPNIANYPGTPDLNWLDQTITLVNGSLSIDNKDIIINGTVVFDENLSFNNCRFYMGAFSKAIVKSGRTVSIARSSVIQSCDKINMWDGFYISDNTATLRITEKTWVQDGRNAVVSKNGGVFRIDGDNIFDLNNISLLVKSASANPTSYFVSNIVKCSNSALMLYPYNNNRSLCGVKVDTCAYVKIGPYNNFNRLDVGVYAYKSGVDLTKNAFSNIAPVQGQFCKAAVWAVGPAPSLNATGNTITNCYEGIYCERPMNIVLASNTFTTIKQNAVFYTGLNNNSVLIDANTITNAGNAVFAYIPGKSISKISNNTINWSNALANYTGIKFFGTNSLNEKVTIGPYNTINAGNAYKAVWVQTTEKPLINDNFITIANKSGGFGQTVPFGIHLLDCPGAKLKFNKISASNNPGPTVNSFGIVFELSENTLLQCNTITSVNTAIKAAGPCLNSKVYNNTMSNNSSYMGKYGLILTNGGSIGPQGSMTQPSDNNWQNCIKDTWSFYSYGITSPIYAQQILNNPLISVIHMTGNYPTHTAFARVGGAQPFPGYSPCTNITPVTGEQNAQLNEIAEHDAGWLLNDAAVKYLAERSIRKIVKYDSLIAADTVLAGYYKRTRYSGMGLLDSALLLLRNDEQEMALLLNNAVPDTLLIEVYEKRINTLELTRSTDENSYTVSETEELREMARQCPFTYGKAVYRARTLLAGMDSLYVEYLSDCETQVEVEERGLHKTDTGTTVNATALMEVTVFPNPSSGMISVLLSADGHAPVTFELRDVLGKLVERAMIPLAVTEYKLDLSRLPGGIYVYVAKEGENVLSFGKIILYNQ